MEKKLKKPKIAKLKLEKTGKILADESEVGYIEFEVDKGYSKKAILDYFKTYKSIPQIKKIKMPKEFTFIWIAKIYVKQSSRGKGFGTKILKLMERKFPTKNLVMGLSPGYLVKTTNIKKLIPFYKRIGYKVIDGGDHYFGFKVVKRSSN